MNMILTLLSIVFSFIFGSIPFGLIIAKAKGIDITKIGSGNIGATNVFRTVGKKYGLLVFLLDALKGFIPTYLAIKFTENHIVVVLCGTFSIFGHMFSPFLKFKGGKGVATGLGVFLALNPNIFILSFTLGTLIITLTGYVSLASITGAVLTAILMFRTGQPLPYSIMALVVAIFIVYKHIPNIQRLLNGTENKISWKN